jgi:autotransporter translocation and assembly factor TamB
MRYITGEQRFTSAAAGLVGISDIRLDVTLRTISPFEINNNVARGELQGELRFLGTLGNPGLTGRIEIEDGAYLTLRERKYSVDRGIITSSEERAIEPILDVIATTTVKAAAADSTSPPVEYDITMKVSGNVTRSWKRI